VILRTLLDSDWTDAVLTVCWFAMFAAVLARARVRSALRRVATKVPRRPPCGGR